MRMSITAPCANPTMSAVSTNLHFHGIAVPPSCHQDDVLKTMVHPGDPPFEYRFRIPADEPPGLYWYHPHVHGFTNAQVLGGASGALIVEGIERANSQLAGLPERVLIIRDQELLNPNAQPAASSVGPAIVLRDAEGDILNTGTGTGKPAKDLSINFVPVPYPDYRAATIEIKPNERQFWRVLNASAHHLSRFADSGRECSSSNSASSLSMECPSTKMARHQIKFCGKAMSRLPPGWPRGIYRERLSRRNEGHARHAHAWTPARSAKTIPRARWQHILATGAAPNPKSILAAAPTALAASREPWLGNVKPIRERKLYFSEQPRDPNDPKSPTDFFITVDGETPRVFDHALHHSEHHCSSRRRGRLDHRESLAGIARLSYSSNPFHARPVEWSSRR